MAKAGTGLAGALGIKRREDPALYAAAWRRANREKANAAQRRWRAKRRVSITTGTVDTTK
jgi:hypothetical protein